MHQKHIIWIKDKNSTLKQQLYQQARQRVQSKLCQMKNNWWDDLAVELQDAADRKDSKCFYDNLKKAYGPRDVNSAPFAVKVVLHSTPTSLIYCSVGLNTSSPC